MRAKEPLSSTTRPPAVIDDRTKTLSVQFGRKPARDSVTRLLLRRTARIAVRSYALGFFLTAFPSLVGLWTKAWRFGKLEDALERSLYVALKALSSRPGRFLAVLMGLFTFLDGAFEMALRRKEQNRNTVSPLAGAEKSTEEQRDGTPHCKGDIVLTFCAGAMAGCLSVLVLPSRLDIALNAAVRAVDYLVHLAYEKHSCPWVPKWVIEQKDALIFAASCSEIMFSWFFHPESLPRSYVKWISYMGDLNLDLVQVMRLVRKGEFYGPQGKQHAGILAPFCRRIGLPESMADGSKGKIPCAVVHGGIRGGCEVHAVARWFNSFFKALKLYLPVHLVPVLLFRSHLLFSWKTTITMLRTVLTAAMRSASFLATFIAVTWYSICFVRTRLGDPLNIPLQWRDGSALGPVLGSLLGGVLSIQFEEKRRRGEMMLYCAPRALYALWWRLKRTMGMKNGIPYADIAIFSASMGVLMTAVQYDRKALRSSTSGILGWLLTETTEER